MIFIDFRTTFLLILLLWCGGCSPGEFLKETVRPREDIREVEFRVPAVSSPQCRAALNEVFKDMRLITQVRIDEAGEILAITYNSRLTAAKNLEYQIAAAGFDINESEGDPVAKKSLPEACQ